MNKSIAFILTGLLGESYESCVGTARKTRAGFAGCQKTGKDGEDNKDVRESHLKRGFCEF